MSAIKTSGVVLIEQTGTPDTLKYHTITQPQPGPNEVLIDQKAIGVNFVDIFFRNGTFPMPSYPAPLGLEAAGVIEQVGADVKGFVVGDRVAYHSSVGSYAEKRSINTSEIFKLPNDISFEQAAAITVKGLTAHMLIKQAYQVKAGDVVLIHAMTGGVGTVLSEWVRSLGATVIGTVGSAAKKELALSRGFEHIVDLQTEDFADKVKAVTQGKGIDVVYDSIGETTFNKSVALLKEGGSAVLYGWASGMPVADEELIAQRKIRFVRPALKDLNRQDVDNAMPEVFEVLRSGIFKVDNPLVYALADAAKAHADLESRKTTGSIILLP